MKPEPKKGEHWEGTPWVVKNPDWPRGYEPYLVLCGGCDKCDPEGYGVIAGKR